MYPGFFISTGIGVIPIYTYSLSLMAGLISGYLLLDRMTRTENADYRTKLFMIVTTGLVIGAISSNRITQFWMSESLLSGSHQAFSFLPGMCAGLIAVAILLRLSRIPVAYSINIGIIPVCVGHGFGRIGCFFAGCCFGKPTQLPWGVIFPDTSLAGMKFGPGIAVHPVQLYEAGFLFLLAWGLYRVPSKIRFFAYLLGYGIFRFCVEFLRGDDRGILFSPWLSPAQVICIGVVGIVFGLSLKWVLGSILKRRYYRRIADSTL